MIIIIIRIYFETTKRIEFIMIKIIVIEFFEIGENCVKNKNGYSCNEHKIQRLYTIWCKLIIS